jgi:signal transduction histidine kinase
MRLQIESNATSMAPDLADALQDELAHLSNYVESALTVARAEQGRIDVKVEKIRLKEFLTELLEPFSRLAIADERRLMWLCPGELTVYADGNTLKQVLVNLLSNALKHGDGDVFLRVRPRGVQTCILLGNRVPHKQRTASGGLGIGLRLVRALTPLMRGTHLAIRKQQYFWVNLRLPSIVPPTS